ncbi:MAG: ParB/RepB/Spo0J family partition protein [Candidatus Competibacteraceae bacterium]|nr:ParB/RepB/Spo0J family partition protein [Candidatus Competibacteraceae bacterium]
MVNPNRPSTLRGKLTPSMFFQTSPDLPRIVEIDLDRLTPNPDQPRKWFDDVALQELAASIDRHGLIQPIIVKEAEGDTFILVAGERRYRAHKLLGRATIVALITQGKPDEIALIENLQREDLNPIEAAEALAIMMERHHYNQEDLGRTIGKNRVTVNELLRLNTLPQKIREECRTSDTLRKSVLIELARLDDESAQLQLWEEIKQGRLATVRAARERKTAQKLPKPRVEKAMQSGQRFILALKSLVNEEPLAETDYQQLRVLYEEMGLALQQLATDSSPDPSE